MPSAMGTLIGTSALLAMSASTAEGASSHTEGLSGSAGFKPHFLSTYIPDMRLDGTVHCVQSVQMPNRSICSFSQGAISLCASRTSVMDAAHCGQVTVRQSSALVARVRSMVPLHRMHSH